MAEPPNIVKGKVNLVDNEEPMSVNLPPKDFNFVDA